MKSASHLLLAVALLFGSSAVVFGGNVRMDYDHSVDFSQYHTYSWGQVKTSDPFYVDRIKQAVNQRLQSKGWRLVPSGGAVTIFATDNVHNQKETQTMYDGIGGGWGGGWGPGIGDATTTTTNQPVANLVIDMFDSSSKKLLWRCLATEDLSTNANKNTKQLDGDIAKMFKDFPPKPNS